MDLDEEDDAPVPSRDGASKPDEGSTLMPSPVASAISLVTRSTGLYLRLGAFIGGLAIDGARVTTLTGLELSRAVLEGILTRAGRDVATRSRGELGRADAEGLLERSIATLHSTITTISFAASTGFCISSTALSSAGDLSQQLLSTLDSILGSTDSSRAIASIVTLIRREFANPHTGQPGEKVGVVDLLMGVCGLALLQRWCANLIELEIREKRVEEVVWDVVILDNGRRADVVSPSSKAGSGHTNSIPLVSSSGEEIVETIERQGAIEDDHEEEGQEIDLRERIMEHLPADASMSITTETTTTKTITVEITGAQPHDLSPPPGMEIVEENAHHTSQVDVDGEVLSNEQKIALLIPRYRVVYRIIRSKMRGANISNGNIEARFGSEESLGETPIRETMADVIAGAPLDENIQYGGPVLPPQPSGTFFLSSESSSPDPEEHPDARGQLVEHFDRLRAAETSSNIPAPTSGSQPANQKRLRKPISMSSLKSNENSGTGQSSNVRPSVNKKLKSDSSIKKNGEKKVGLRKALRKGSGVAISNLWNKDQPTPVILPPPNNKVAIRPPWGGIKPPSNDTSAIRMRPSNVPIPPRGSSNTVSGHSRISSMGESSMIPARDAPRAPPRGNPNYFSSRDLGMKPDDVSRAPSRTSYYSIHEQRRDSIVSQTDTYSIHSTSDRPGSPTAFRTHLRAQNNLMRAKSEKNIPLNVPASPQKNHRRAKSHVPSIYTLKTNNSETDLVIAPRNLGSAYDVDEAINTLSRTGHIDGLFPEHHLVRNITRFIRFASASYGANFMKVMGISSVAGTERLKMSSDHHIEHHSFSHHTQLPASSILLSSFVDPQGGTDSTGRTDTGVPMVHFVSLDHDSRAVVLTCRGTLGFEDILTDMTCEYDNLVLCGKSYKVHKGIHASALRLLSGNGSRVIATLAAALEEFPEYGLVMCGHSLGGGVVSLLAILVSELGSTTSTAFVTSRHEYQQTPQRQITSSTMDQGIAPGQQIRLPPGRPIHVYAYGPPATLSPSLRLLTRGLITTIVNGQDLVPYLSLGVLHDLQAVALAFKTDDSGAKGEVRARVWAGFTSGFADKWYGNRPPPDSAGNDSMGIGTDSGLAEEDQWAYAALKTLRASMLSEKLVPPGEVFCVESEPVLQRDAFTNDNVNGVAGRGLGRPATRAVLRYLRDVEKRFGELRFGGSMLLDHSPGRYEVSLRALGKGVLG